MGCLYLHIGTPKTGTSTIQYFLAQNRKTLKKKGYNYPSMGFRFENIGKDRNAHFLVQNYFNERHERLYVQEKALREEGMEKLLVHLSEYENVILSDESIWNAWHSIPNFWDDLYDALKAHGHSLKVIVYLRRQDAYIQSYWQQTVKSSQKLDFSGFLDTEPWRRVHAAYERNLDKIAAFIGQENIIVRPFERGQFYQGPLNQSLLSDFLHFVGLELTDEYDESDRIKNDSVAGEYIKVKQILNARPEFSDKKGFMFPLMHVVTMQKGGRASYKRACSFPSGTPSDFLKKFEAGNTDIAKRYLHREDGILFYEKPENEEKVEPYSTEELINACGDIILELQRQLTDAKKQLNPSTKQQVKDISKKVTQKAKSFPGQFISKFTK
ncbi:MAG: hypothetical protein LUH14_00555 [Clostridiaceae bacterium]|nr:hypothetical protein [Clostridiaceae bacterium]